MDISNWVAHRALWAPTKTATRFESGDWTNVQFEDRVGRLAGALKRELGVGEGDRVAHLGLNSPDLLALFFACARIGAMIVPLNWRLTPSEHAYQLGDSAPVALLVEPEYWEHVGRIRSQFEHLHFVAYRGKADPGPGWIDYEAMLAAAAPLPPDPKRDLRTPCEIKYTSGTTGKPKGSVRTQEGVLFNALNSGYVFELTPQDHVLTAIPMFHAGGMHIQTTPAVHWGATITIHRRFEPAAVLAEIRASRPTLLLAVPAVSAALVAHPDFPATDVSCLKCVCGGSSVVPDAVIKPWTDRGIPFNQVYGMTETGPTAIASSIADGRLKSASAGKQVPYMEARLVDDAGRDVATGQRGEIWLRGPALLKEYWRNPEATAESFDLEGWFKTGDVAHRDEDGFFYVDDRKKDMIISGGENIYPAELENVLADCADIAEFAVIGRPDERWGEIPVACIVLKAGCAMTKEQVIGLFQNRLARYKHPRDVIFLSDTLPRTSLGKVQKFALRTRLGIG
ncbi:MAG: AMP-binding protein [Rhodospirillaceae bacterium]|nr:AMP-binding protein [Rhodospirillaceae bacterium]